MENIIFVYPPCSTCKKALAFLEENQITIPVRNIKQNPPTKEELLLFASQSGLALRKFLNTSGMLYRQRGLAKLVPSMSEEELLTLLSSDGMLVKRPILVYNATVLVGFRQPAWEALFC